MYNFTTYKPLVYISEKVWKYRNQSGNDWGRFRNLPGQMDIRIERLYLPYLHNLIPIPLVHVVRLMRRSTSAIGIGGIHPGLAELPFLRIAFT